MILTHEQIDNLKDKNDTSLDERPLSRQECRNLIRTIEAQQQEIDRLKNLVNEQSVLLMEKCTDIEALVSDKDEQAGRIMRMDYLLRRTLPILEVTNNQQGLIDAINALLGGAEDGSSKDK